jgi:hypothetical protein
VPRQRHSLTLAPRGSRHDGVSVAIDLKVLEGAQRCLDRVGQVGLVPALGVMVDQCRRQRRYVLTHLEFCHVGTVTT